MRHLLITTATLAAFASPILAAGSDDDEPPAKTKTTVECEEGQVWDEEKEKCVNAEDVKESNLGDDALYAITRELAYDGQYDNALTILSAMSNQDDPRVLNYRGFIARQLGDIPTAFAYYERAIDADPTYSLARSYYGQGLVSEGRYAEAFKQLYKIKKNGYRKTWAYASLADTIRTGQPKAY